MLDCLMVDVIQAHAVWYLSKDCSFPQHVATCVEKDMLSRLYEMEYTVQIASLFRFTTLQIIILDSIYFR